MLVSHAAIIYIVTQWLTSPAPLPGPTMLCGEHWSISWWDKKRWVVIMSTKWLLCTHHAVVFKTKILHFKVKDSVKTHSKKGKFWRTLIFLFVDNESFYYQIVLGEIQPCFHGGADTNCLKKIQVHFVHHGHNLSFRCSECSGNITRWWYGCYS